MHCREYGRQAIVSLLSSNATHRHAIGHFVGLNCSRTETINRDVVVNLAMLGDMTLIYGPKKQGIVIAPV